MLVNVILSLGMSLNEVGPLDRAVTLNARRATPDDEHEIIEAAIQKFPADLVDKIEAKTEATKNAEEDLDIARACWATVIERSGLRTKAREAERAMAAAANGDARIAALEARLAAAELRATRAETAAVAAAAGGGGGVGGGGGGGAAPALLAARVA